MRLYTRAAFDTVMENINKHAGIIYVKQAFAPQAIEATHSHIGSETHTYM